MIVIGYRGKLGIDPDLAILMYPEFRSSKVIRIIYPINLFSALFYSCIPTSFFGFIPGFNTGNSYQSDAVEKNLLIQRQFIPFQEPSIDYLLIKGEISSS